MANLGTVDGNTHVVGFPHQGTYDTALADGDTLIITLPRIARSVAVLTPVEMRWLPTTAPSLALIDELSIPTKVGVWHERVRQFTVIALHNASGAEIALDTISWDAELTEFPQSEYPLLTLAKGFDGYSAAHSLATIATDTPA